MGYFGTASVLISEPNWQALEGLQDLGNLRGYRHKTQPLWLIEVGFREGRTPDYAFTAEPGCKSVVSPENTPAEIVETRQSIQQVIVGVREAFETIDTQYLDIAIRLAYTLGQTVFTFAADDDLIDHACQVSPDGIDLFACKSHACLYQFSDANHQVKLYPYEEEPEEIAHLESIKKNLHTVSPLAEVEIVDFDESYSQFYYCPHTCWPKEGGNPEKMLGIGTWDPYMNLQDDYEIVFEKISEKRKPTRSNPEPSPSSTKKPANKPWWKFW